MNKTENNKIDFSKKVFTEGELPPIIADGVMWEHMKKYETSIFYPIFRENQNPLLGLKQSSVKGLLNYPEANINQAYLVNKRANPAKWHYIVNLLNYCLEQSLTQIMKKAAANIDKQYQRIEKIKPYYDLINS